MSEWGVYWKFFKKERETGPVQSWLVGGGSPLVHTTGGDHLWLFTSGDLCSMPERKLGYLVQILTVEDLEGIPDEHFKWRIHSKNERSSAITPPLLVDSFIRPSGWDSSRSIGSLRQCPWKLSDNTAYELRCLVRDNAPEAFSSVFPEE
jgi:hypothetical protein